MKVTIILEARQFPLGSTVRRPTGEKPYTLRDRIEVHGAERITVSANKGTLFLCAADGVHNSILDTTRVAADFELDEASTFLQMLEMQEMESHEG